MNDDLDLVAMFDLQGYPAPLEDDNAGTCLQCGGQSWFLVQTEKWKAHFCSDDCFDLAKVRLGESVTDRQPLHRRPGVLVENKERSEKRQPALSSLCEDDF